MDPEIEAQAGDNDLLDWFRSFKLTVFSINWFTFGRNLSLVAESTATGGRVDGPVPYDGANQYSNVGYPVKNEGTFSNFYTGLEALNHIYSLKTWTFCLNMSVSGQTGLYDGPVPNGAATRYANAKPVSKDSKSSNI